MRALILAVSIVLSGCATTNAYKKFYTDETKGVDMAKEYVVLPTDAPTLVDGTTPVEDAEKMEENGYLRLGYSSFEGPIEEKVNAIKFGKTIHAAVVTVCSAFNKTISGSMPMTMPTSQTSYSTANATAYGAGGPVTAYGSGQTTTYGTQTTYVPFSIDRYNQAAQFWIKAKPSILGIRAMDLSADKRQALGSNKGVEVRVVVKDTPAFAADFLKGDIVKKIGDREIVTVKDFYDSVGTNAGKQVDIEFIRSGKSLKKTVQLNNRAT